MQLLEAQATAEKPFMPLGDMPSVLQQQCTMSAMSAFARVLSPCPPCQHLLASMVVS